ncbi:hypothetical protein GCM10027615_80440 [Plantactinospora veratri]
MYCYAGPPGKPVDSRIHCAKGTPASGRDADSHLADFQAAAGLPAALCPVPWRFAHTQPGPPSAKTDLSGEEPESGRRRAPPPPDITRRTGCGTVSDHDIRVIARHCRISPAHHCR